MSPGLQAAPAAARHAWRGSLCSSSSAQSGCSPGRRCCCATGGPAAWQLPGWWWLCARSSCRWPRELTALNAAAPVLHSLLACRLHHWQSLASNLAMRRPRGLLHGAGCLAFAIWQFAGLVMAVCEEQLPIACGGCNSTATNEQQSLCSRGVLCCAAQHSCAVHSILPALFPCGLTTRMDRAGPSALVGMSSLIVRLSQSHRQRIPQLQASQPSCVHHSHVEQIKFLQALAARCCRYPTYQVFPLIAFASYATVQSQGEQIRAVVACGHQTPRTAKKWSAPAGRVDALLAACW